MRRSRLRPSRSTMTPANGASRASASAGTARTTGTGAALPGTWSKCSCMRGSTGARSTAPRTGRQLPAMSTAAGRRLAGAAARSDDGGARDAGMAALRSARRGRGYAWSCRPSGRGGVDEGRRCPRLCVPVNVLPTPCGICVHDVCHPSDGWWPGEVLTPLPAIGWMAAERGSHALPVDHSREARGQISASATRRPTLAAVSRSQMWAASCVWTGCHQSASRSGTAS